MIKHSMKANAIKIVAFILFLIIFIFPSPILYYYFIPGSYFSIIASLFCIILLCREKNRLNLLTLIISLIFIAYALILAIAINNTTIISLILGLPLCLIVYSLCNYRISDILSYICNFATPFFILGTISIIVSVIYFYIGGGALFSIENPDGRVADFYLSSLSNSKVGNIIRPSFIYDEAGAYSFYLSILCLMRIYLGRNKWLTLTMLYGSLLTFSLTHLLICFFFTIKLLNKKQLILFLIPAIVVFSSLIIRFSDDVEFFINRLDVNAIQDNNRTAQLDNFKSAINRNDNILLVGNLECLARIGSKCIEDGDITSSPATPIYRLGILGAFIQIAFLILSLANYRKKNCIFIAMILNLLLLQRPFFTAIYYSFSIFIFIFLFFYANKKPIRGM